MTNSTNRILAHSSRKNLPQQQQQPTHDQESNHVSMMSILTKIVDASSTSFDIEEEVIKLNAFKDAINSTYNINANIEEISIYYQCRGETEEEALIIDNDEEFNDILYFHKIKEIEVINFIINFNECGSSIKIDDKFDDKVV
eukprot:492848_1